MLESKPKLQQILYCLFYLLFKDKRHYILCGIRQDKE